jgi:predicted pyridoxine 5'-phosphate oxidase superfamily flavin-nucleotide-binding protein
MAYNFLDLLATDSVKAAQAENGSRQMWADLDAADRAFDRFTENEIAFIAERDSFYMASVSESGWPYIQHRGGPPGFLKVLDDKTLAFADFRGNRQYISLGNVAHDGRVALFLMDYPNRARLKILAHVRAVTADAELVQSLLVPGYRGRPERAFLLTLEAFDWNCSQHITPRFTAREIDMAIAPMREEIADLRAENEDLRRQLGLQETQP